MLIIIFMSLNHESFGLESKSRLPIPKFSGSNCRNRKGEWNECQEKSLNRLKA